MKILLFIGFALTGYLIYEIRRRIIKATTKQCPYCAERIKKKAVLCRWCGKSLNNPIERMKPAIEGTVMGVKNIVEEQKINSANMAVGIVKTLLVKQPVLLFGLTIVEHQFFKKKQNK